MRVWERLGEPKLRGNRKGFCSAAIALHGRLIRSFLFEEVPAKDKGQAKSAPTGTSR